MLIDPGWVVPAAAFFIILSALIERLDQRMHAKPPVPRHHSVVLDARAIVELIAGREVILTDRLDTVGISTKLTLPMVQDLVAYVGRRALLEGVEPVAAGIGVGQWHAVDRAFPNGDRR